MIALTGCAATPVARSFPEAPKELMTSCSDLKQIDSNITKLSEVVLVVTTNYGLYQECQIKSNGWIEWYNSQKKIFDSVE
jgi:hypothetical protein